MTPADTDALRTAAARNNADWCAAVCRSHGVAGTVGPLAWWSARRTPPYYPDAITLHPDASPADVLAPLDTATPGCSVKDSFGTLDLGPSGFVALFDAQWIHRPPQLPAPLAPRTPALRVERVSTAARLLEWQAAWHGGDGGPDVFRAPLLDEPSVRVLAFHAGDELVGGAVLNHAAGLVGLSNLFAVDGADGTAVWSSAISAAGRHFPGLPLVGYEHGDDLAQAHASGFSALGPLRVWLHDA